MNYFNYLLLLTNHSKIQQLKIAVFYYFSQFCGFTGINWTVLLFHMVWLRSFKWVYSAGRYAVAGTSTVASHPLGPPFFWPFIILLSSLGVFAARWLPPKKGCSKRTSPNMQKLIKPLLALGLLVSSQSKPTDEETVHKEFQ